jgi:hypothetical protein
MCVSAAWWNLFNNLNFGYVGQFGHPLDMNNKSDSCAELKKELLIILSVSYRGITITLDWCYIERTGKSSWKWMNTVEFSS